MLVHSGKPFLCLMLILFGSATAVGDTVPETASRPMESVARERPQTQQQRETQALLEAERSALETLYREFRATRDHETALGIQRRIARTKQQTEIDLLRIQGLHARRAKNLEVARELEDEAKRLQTRLDERFAIETGGE